MKFVTFYFSGTGNTKWVVDSLDKLLKNRGHQSIIYSVDEEMCKSNLDLLLQTIKSVDFFGFAYPLYGANMPRIMRCFIEDLFRAAANFEGLISRIFFINTFAYINGHGVFEAKKLLNSRLYSIYGYINIKLTNSAPSKKRKKPLFGKYLPSIKKQNTIKRLKRFIDRIEKNKKYINGIGPHLFIGKVIRNAIKDNIKNNYTRMHIDMKTCNKCMVCVNNCPTKSIVFKDNAFKYLKTCEACMRCYHNCAQHSISNI